MDVLGNRVTTAESSLEVISYQISGIVTRLNTIDGSIESAGWITQVEGNTFWASKTLESGGTIVSLINQSAEGVTISASHIKLEGLVTANNNVQFTLDGKIIAVGGEFSGKITATSGSIGGFTIASGRIGSEASGSGSGGGLAIYDNLFRVGGNYGYVLFGDNVIPASAGGAFSAAGRIVNNRPNASLSYGFDTANYGLFIDVSGGTKNFGIDSNAPLKAPAFIGTKVGSLVFSGSTYSIDLSQQSLFSVYASSSYSVTLPSESSVASQFGYSSLPAYFAAVFTFVMRSGSQNITLNSVYNENHSSANITLGAGDVITLMVTKWPSFHYKVLSRYY